MGCEDWTWKKQPKLTLPGDERKSTKECLCALRGYSSMDEKVVPYICIYVDLVRVLFIQLVIYW